MGERPGLGLFVPLEGGKIGDPEELERLSLKGLVACRIALRQRQPELSGVGIDGEGIALKATLGGGIA